MVAASLSLIDVEQSVCRAEFYTFVRRFWPLVVSEKLIDNWHIQYLCAQLQVAAERVMRGEENPADILINIPPGTSKSTIVSIMFPAWVWTRMPAARFICGSYTATVAHHLGMKCKDVVDSDKYQELFPEVGKMRSDARASSMFVNEHKGYRLAVGAGAATGFHGDFILVDDPIDPVAAVSEADRASAVRWMADMLSTRKTNKEVTVTVLVMQRLHQADPAALLLGQIEDKAWGHPVQHICLPWKLSDKVRPIKLRARYSDDGLLDPIRLSQKVGDTFKAKLGSFGFSCQFEQSPVPLEGGMFHTENINFGDPPLLWKRKVRYWDNAASENGGAARTAGVLMGEDLEHRFWILDVVAGRWDSDVRERIKRSTAQLDGVKVKIGIEQEGGSAGLDTARNTIRRTLVGFTALSDKPTGDKATRADPFSVQVNCGNVWMPKSRDGEPIKWQALYLDEMKHFPASQFKDQIDATSGAFKLMTARVRAGAAFPEHSNPAAVRMKVGML